jgi:hypothetical protein
VEFLKLLRAAYKILGRVLGRIRVVTFLASLVVKGPLYRLAY